ncbi:MAG: type IV pilus modification protein PilV [Leucothrix sp.]
MLKHHSQSGFSLIEIMASVLIVAIGLIGLAGMQLVGLKGNQQSFSKNQAAHHTQSLLERMRGNPSGVFNDHYVVDSTVLDCTVAPTANCIAATSNCDAEDIAKYDIYQAFCGSQNTSSGGIRRDLSDAVLVISCPVDCVSGVSIRINWQEQVLGKESSSASTPRQLTLNTSIGK